MEKGRVARWKKKKTLKCLCPYSDLLAWNAAAYGRRGDTRAAARYITLDFPVFLCFVFPVSASLSFQLITSLYLFVLSLLHSASSPHLCQTCMQSGLCKYSCTQGCKTIWIPHSTIRDGTQHVPHAHAHKEKDISQFPSPFFSLFLAWHSPWIYSQSWPLSGDIDVGLLMMRNGTIMPAVKPRGRTTNVLQRPGICLWID